MELFWSVQNESNIFLSGIAGVSGIKYSISNQNTVFYVILCNFTNTLQFKYLILLEKEFLLFLSSISEKLMFFRSL